jgi:DNA (cytosine-5)-methyltransferase 1
VRAIELFCGIGGFRVAMERLGIETVFANDIDEKVARVYAANFGPAGLVRGDVRAIPDSAFPEHDLLVGGFPCQSFSPAGKKLGVDDPERGGLFREIARVLAARRPRHFLLENVRRLLSMQDGRHFRVILSALANLGYVVEWRLVNAVSFGIPQARQRVLIAGWRDDGADRAPRLGGDPAAPARLRPFGPPWAKHRFWGLATAEGFVEADLPDDLAVAPKRVLRDILQPPGEVDPTYDYTGRMAARLAASEPVDRLHNGVHILYNQKGGARFGYTVFGPDGVASTLTASASRHYERYLIDGAFRRLTNVEYARLMGFPDGWCDALGKYDQHAAYGNAVVPDCVEWALRRLVRPGA